MGKHMALEGRATEAAELIRQLLADDFTMERIATKVKVSERTVYRWLNEGRAPHPILLDSLRRLGRRNANHASEE